MLPDGGGARVVTSQAGHRPVQTPQLALVESRSAGELVVVGAERSGHGVLAHFRIAARLVAARRPAAKLALAFIKQTSATLVAASQWPPPRRANFKKRRSFERSELETRITSAFFCRETNRYDGAHLRTRPPSRRMPSALR